MRDLSTAYKTSASGDTRNYMINLHVWKKSVDDNGNVSFPADTKAVYTSSDSLISVSIVDGQTSGNSFQLGQTFCPIISFSTVPNLNIKTGDKVQVELVFTSTAKATLATGYIDEYSYDSIDYAVSYTAYGKMLQLDKDYKSALTYPATFSAVVEEICSQNGLTFDTFAWKCNAKLKAKPVFGNLDNGDPAYASAREMLGIIAGVNGCNVVIGADEKVKFVPYTDTKTGITYEDAFSRQVNNEKYIIKKAVLNDGGQTTGDEVGYVELYFPLETVEGKASCLEKLNSVITGLSVMGMTVQTQGKGYYEIGDMLSYTDFDGEKYTIGVMGIKYDFSGGYFTETLYSLAPSEMEEQHKGNVRYSSASTTLKNPVVISENTSSYLGYQYHTIGYRKGDKITYGLDGGNPDIIVQGYKATYDPTGIGALCGNFNVVNGIYAAQTYDATPFTKLSFYIEITRVVQYTEYTVYWIDLISEYTTKDGETVKEIEKSLKARHGNFSPALKWMEIIPPSNAYPNGYAVIYYGINFHDNNSSNPDEYSFRTANNAGVSFSSIAEYNAAVRLSGESLTMYDITQDVMKIGEADEPTDLPTIGDVDTLYITYQPPACWKYSTITSKYYCVGRNYRELQRIKSSTEASNALEVLNVPVIFDCRTKTEWELEANTVYPKGFMIFEQNPESREITHLKIANGIDKLSNLKYTNVTESDLSKCLTTENVTVKKSETTAGEAVNSQTVQNTITTSVSGAESPATSATFDTVTYGEASTEKSGLLSFADKTKIDSFTSPTDIAGQTVDLNTLTANTTADKGKSKKYYCASANASGIAHRPVSVNEAFELTVTNILFTDESTYRTMQRYVSAERERAYVRWCENGTWKAWACETDRLIYATATVATPKTLEASNLEGYQYAWIEAYYDNISAPLTNKKFFRISSTTNVAERDLLKYPNGTIAKMAITNGKIILSVTGVEDYTVPFRIIYTNNA
nr:MAG TPA: hypothetical protein [Caudoviricetes sp.]